METYHKSKEKIVKKVFEDVFSKYDLMNDIMSLGIHRFWKKNLINWLNPQKNKKLVDVASGTGDVTKLFLERVGYLSDAYCVDENQGMLNLSKKKFNNTHNIKWINANAESLPFDDNFFDYYTISFGIRNVRNINKAIKEAHRVLKPGGRFLCLEFSKVENEILNKFYKMYSKSIPKIGKLIIGKSEPYEYLVKSIEKFYSQEEFYQVIKLHDFANVTYRSLSGGIVCIHSAWKV